MCIFHLLLSNLWKTRFNDKFVRRRGFCSNLKCRFDFFFRKIHALLRYKLAMANYIADFGNEENIPKQPIRELYGVTKLVGQMPWHLEQVTKDFYWWSVLKNALSRGVLKRNCKLTWKHLWPRVYSVFNETLPYRPRFYTKKGETLIYMTRSSWLW